MASDQSPLLQSTSPDSISDLFLADPATLSEADLSRLVTELRRRRSEYLSAEAAAAAKPKSTRKQSAETKAAIADAVKSAELDKPTHELTLDDLLGDA